MQEESEQNKRNIKITLMYLKKMLIGFIVLEASFFAML